MKHEYLLHTCKITPDGTGEIMGYEGACNFVPGNGFLWVHLHATHPGSRTWIENNTLLNPLVVDALLAKETRPRLLQHEDGLMAIFRAMNLNNAEEPEDMIALRMWIDENMVITTRTRDIRAIEDIMQIIKSGEGIKSSADFLIMITSRMFARMEPFIEALEEDISKAEEQIVLGNDSILTEGIAKIRKQTTIYRRYIIPQKVVVDGLLNTPYPWIKEEHKQQLTEDLDRVTRFVEELDELRDRSHILNDEVRNLHAERLNGITYIFSVAATIFLPLSFLTGLLGVNLGGMPWVENDNAFWVFTLSTVVITALLIYIFKKLGWF